MTLFEGKTKAVGACKISAIPSSARSCFKSAVGRVLVLTMLLCLMANRVLAVGFNGHLSPSFWQEQADLGDVYFVYSPVDGFTELHIEGPTGLPSSQSSADGITYVGFGNGLTVAGTLSFDWYFNAGDALNAQADFAWTVGGAPDLTTLGSGGPGTILSGNFSVDLQAGDFFSFLLTTLNPRGDKTQAQLIITNAQFVPEIQYVPDASSSLPLLAFSAGCLMLFAVYAGRQQARMARVRVSSKKNKILLGLLALTLGLSSLTSYGQGFQLVIANYTANTFGKYTNYVAIATNINPGRMDNANFMLPRYNGEVIVAMGGSNNLEVYNLYNNTWLRTFAAGNTNGLDFPEQMRIGPDGYLYVASQNNDVVRRFNGVGSVATNGSTFLDSSDGINAPLGLIWIGTNVYVSNNESGGQIRKYDSNGNFVSILYDYPTGEAPRGLELGPDGNIYVIVNISSPAGSRIDRFTMPAGTRTVFIPTITGAAIYNGIDWGPDGNLYLANFGQNQYRVYNSVGTSVTNIATPTGPHHLIFQAYPQASDYGDLLAYYPTTLSDNGPRHVVTTNWMGASIDIDGDGQPSTYADGDDTDGDGDDEDGVIIPPLIPGQNATFSIIVTNIGVHTNRLNTFIDWNGDTDFADANEAIGEITITNGTNTLIVSVPSGASTGINIGLRFRLSRAGGLSDTGQASDGELEDYIRMINMDYGDLPDTNSATGIGNYQTLFAYDGPRHVVVSTLRLGATEDVDTDGVSSSSANGDDTTTSDDEDGVTVADLSGMPRGGTRDVNISVFNNTGVNATLWGWIDFNTNGVVDVGETQTNTVATSGSSQNVIQTFTVPSNAAATTYARFRLGTNSTQVTIATGVASNGEVEDYVATTEAFDWGDLPDSGAGTGSGNYETLLASGGPRHLIISNLRLGATVDAESDGQPNIGATGDGLDEDGVTNSTDLANMSGSRAVRLSLFNNTGVSATLWGWIDFNGNGVVDVANNETRTNTISSSASQQSSTLTFTVPGGSAVQTYARFRISTNATEATTPNGLSNSGEVEDYVATTTAFDFGDLPDTGAGVGTGNYETLLVNDGPRHASVTGLRIGTNWDSEITGTNSAAANGDDNTGAPDDEDGVTVADLTNMPQGTNQIVRVAVTNNTGVSATLWSWVDFDGDGTVDSGETATNTVPSAVGTQNFTNTFFVPSGSANSTFARFRIGTNASEVTLATGLANSGEVEDYPVTTLSFDFGDLPDTTAGTGAGNYQTYRTNNGPRHVIINTLRLGTTIDAEATGFPSTAANGDDLDFSNDEDGVTNVTDLASMSGTRAVRLSVFNNTGSAVALWGWIDFNGNGVVDVANNETRTNSVPSSASQQNSTLTFTVPGGSVASTYARFRIGLTNEVTNAVGQASSGEVEDYVATTQALDFGDLPDTGAGIGAGNYETLLDNDGPRHALLTGLRLGTNWDSEITGTNTTTALGDDNTGTPDDEDGVLSGLTSMPQGTNQAVRVAITNNTGQTATLWSWIDFNTNGVVDAGESLTNTINSATGTQFVTNSFFVPGGSAASSYARFRLGASTNAAQVTSPTGFANTGEVEDYPVTTVIFDFGDMPDPSNGVGSSNYTTLRIDNGARHLLANTNTLRIGTIVDAEGDGVPNTDANGDDTANSADEDGVTLLDLAGMTRGASQDVTVSVLNNTGGNAFLWAWIDFDGDGTVDSGESRTNTVAASASQQNSVLTFTVPGGAVSRTFARFRLGTTQSEVVAPTGQASNGEVEDYVVTTATYDFGDLPDASIGVGQGNYETLLANDGPRHATNAFLRLGTNWDSESTGVSSSTASGDDTAGTDDEDGVTITHLTKMPRGQDQTVSVSVFNNTGENAYLWGWIDFDTNGLVDFAESETIIVPSSVSQQSVTLTFAVPFNEAASTYARFRLGTVESEVTTPTGKATDGEVEDYVVTTSLYDFGDLPDTGTGVGTGNYETYYTNNAPRHAIINSLRIGANVDSEIDGTNTTSALGDDNTGAPDDEDGVTAANLLLMPQGQNRTVTVAVTNNTGVSATLWSWVDFDADGTVDAGETQTNTIVSAVASTNVSVVFAVPVGAATSSYARFRLGTNSTEVTSPTGSADSGEVEDYPVTTQAFDFGDLPDTGAGVGSGNYETLLANNGPRHVITTGLRIGVNEDAEANGVSSVNADGDDTAGGPDDEEGVSNLLQLIQGQSTNVIVTVTNNTGSSATLWSWIDFDGDGAVDNGETATNTIVSSVTATNVTNNFTVPFGGVTSTYARFRLALSGVEATTPTGLANSGEVEDYVVTTVAYDFGDLNDTSALTGTGNYQTLLANSGPRHVLVAGSVNTGLKLGATVDAEANGQPNATATGDDVAVGDDEDGVAIPSLYTGLSATIVVTVSNAPSGAKVNGFIDWNNDGDFLDANEALTELSAVNGPNNLNIVVPVGAVTGANLGARFRVSTAGGLNSEGLAGNGEVEDYLVIVTQSATICGHLYFDMNGDGNQDVGEPNVTNVTVNVTNSLGGLQVTSSDVSGNWSVTVPPGSTTAKVLTTDPDFMAQIPIGYTQTEGTDPTTVNLSSGQTACSADGYWDNVPTLALLASIRGYAEDHVATIEWTTASEVGTLGFDLYRQTEGGDWTKVNNDLVIALNSLAGGTYKVQDPGADIPGTYTYKLVEWEQDGDELIVGTYELTIEDPIQLKVTRNEIEIILEWKGGRPPYVVEQRTTLKTEGEALRLPNDGWEVVPVKDTSATSMTMPIEGSANFFRVRGGTP